MKTINVTFDDDDHERLSEKKGDGRSWREFILELAGIKKRGENK